MKLLNDFIEQMLPKTADGQSKMLMAISIVSGVVGTVLAIKGTLDMQKDYTELCEKCPEGEKPDNKQVAKLAAKHFGPVLIAEIVSGTTAFQSYRTSHDENVKLIAANAELVGAYNVLSKSYNDLSKAQEEVLPEETRKEIEAKVANKQLEEAKKVPATQPNRNHLEYEEEMESDNPTYKYLEKWWCYEPRSKRWFRTCFDEVQDVVAEFNKQLRNGGNQTRVDQCMSLNQLYLMFEDWKNLKISDEGELWGFDPQNHYRLDLALSGDIDPQGRPAYMLMWRTAPDFIGEDHGCF